MKLYFTIGVLMFISTGFMPALAAASRQGAAAGWMVGVQGEDGSWGESDMEIDNRAHLTSSAIVSLLDYRGEDRLYMNSAEEGTAWLREQELEEVIGMSAAILTLSRAYLETGDIGLKEKEGALIAGLLEAQNGDGGWGEKRGGASRPWHTAEAVKALLSTNQSAEASIKGAEYLIETQLSDGSWEHSPLVTSSSVTALALVFASHGGGEMLGSALGGQEWLLENQGPGGEWLNSLTTGRCLAALKTLDALLGDRKSRRSMELTKTWLYDAQNPDGSWSMPIDGESGGSVLATSCVLSALGMEAPLAPLEPEISFNMTLRNLSLEAGEELILEMESSNTGYVNLVDLKAELNLEDSERVHGTWDVPIVDVLGRGESIGSEVKLQLSGQTAGSRNLTAFLSYETESEPGKRFQSPITYTEVELSLPKTKTPEPTPTFPEPMPEPPENQPGASTFLVSVALLLNLILALDLGGA